MRIGKIYLVKRLEILDFGALLRQLFERQRVNVQPRDIIRHIVARIRNCLVVIDRTISISVRQYKRIGYVEYFIYALRFKRRYLRFEACHIIGSYAHTVYCRNVIEVVYRRTESVSG